MSKATSRANSSLIYDIVIPAKAGIQRENLDTRFAVPRLPQSLAARMRGGCGVDP